MSDAVDLQLARVERETDNTNVSVRDLLRVALKHIEDGDFKNPIKAMVLIVDDSGGSWNLEAYRCGLGRLEEMGFLQAFVQKSWSHLVVGGDDS